MTELSSQFYSNGLNQTHKSAHWLKATKLLFQDKITEVQDGEKGIIGNI